MVHNTSNDILSICKGKTNCLNFASILNHPGHISEHQEQVRQPLMIINDLYRMVLYVQGSFYCYCIYIRHNFGALLSWWSAIVWYTYNAYIMHQIKNKKHFYSHNLYAALYLALILPHLLLNADMFYKRSTIHNTEYKKHFEQGVIKHLTSNWWNSGSARTNVSSMLTCR